jgi:ClpP class serine protease
MSVADLLFIFLVILALSPIVQLKLMDLRRSRTMAAIQKARGTRVVSLIHRQEVMALLGLPVFRYIDIADSEEILRAIRLTPSDVPIDFIVHTPGGLVLATEQIAFALLRHPAPVTIFVPHYAMSGGTLLALAADAIVMDPNAVLGPVDPQVGKYPAASILAAVAEKDRNEVDDDTLILADVSRKAIEQMTETVTAILNEKLPRADAERLARTLTEGRWTHDFPITVDQARALGLTVSTDMPQEFYHLMRLFPQPPRRRPSVFYVPLPSPSKDEKSSGRARSGRDE